MQTPKKPLTEVNVIVDVREINPGKGVPMTKEASVEECRLFIVQSEEAEAAREVSTLCPRSNKNRNFSVVRPHRRNFRT